MMAERREAGDGRGPAGSSAFVSRREVVAIRSRWTTPERCFSSDRTRWHAETSGEEDQSAGRFAACLDGRRQVYATQSWSSVETDVKNRGWGSVGMRAAVSPGRRFAPESYTAKRRYISKTRRRRDGLTESAVLERRCRRVKRAKRVTREVRATTTSQTQAEGACYDCRGAEQSTWTNEVVTTPQASQNRWT